MRNNLRELHLGELELAATRKCTPVALRGEDSFWQARHYDFNVWSKRKRVEKLRCIHRNRVKRGLVKKPEEWAWSSFRHDASGEVGGRD
ncbi:MAG: hypothetical protein WCA20_14430 [Candidatus Sulfotelmatobacter sp.]